MKKEIIHNHKQDYPFYILLTLVILLPLIFTTSVESIFTQVKSTAFRILSSAFFISCLLYLYNRMKQGKAGLIINKGLDSAVLLIFLSALISTAFSINPYVSIFGQYARQVGFITYAILTLLYFAVPVCLTSTEKSDKLLQAMTITAALVGIYSVIQYFGLDPFKIQPAAYTRPVSSMGSSVFAAGLMVMVLPFAVFRVFEYKLSIINLIIPVLILVGIVISQTRTVYAAVLVELILFCIFYPYLLKYDLHKFIKARRTGLLILGSAAVILILFVLIFPDSIFIKRFKGIVNIRKTERWELWKAMFNMYWHYPVTGTGVAAFSLGLEDFLTTSLKNKNLSQFYDHAHSNYLHTLATMGIIGLSAYLFLLFTIIRKAVTPAFSNPGKKNRNGFFMAFICMTGGYMVYGLADFDELTNFAYFFVLLAVLKTELYTAGKGSSLKLAASGKAGYRFIFSSAVLVIIAFSLFNFYDAYTEFKADKIYHDGIETYNKTNKDINSLNKNLNEAIDLNPRAEYRYMYAYYNFFYNIYSPRLNPETGRDLLQKAEAHLKIAVKDHPVKLLCLGLLSLINYYEGDTLEAEKIKNEVLAKDTLQSKFRVELARYYFINNKEEPALEQLNIVNRNDPRNIEAYFTKIIYLMQKGDFNAAEECCNKILRYEPANNRVGWYLNEIRKMKEILK